MDARRTPVMVAMSCAALLGGAGLSAQEISLSLEKTGDGSYLIQGAFEVEAASVTAWEVLTDYENIARFVPSLKKSRVVERRESGLLLEQAASGTFAIFSRRVTVLLDVRETPQSGIDFEDISRRNFKFYSGSWRIEMGTDPRNSRVIYSLKAKRKFMAPDFMARNAMSESARSLLTEVRREMLRRERAL